jgi:hypothetical protein
MPSDDRASHHQNRVLASPRTLSPLQIRNSSHPYVQALLGPSKQGRKILNGIKALSDPIVQHILKRVSNSPNATRRFAGVPFPKTYDDFLPEIPLTEAATLAEELRWTSNVFSEFARPLARFLQSKLSLEEEVIRGDYVSAQRSFLSIVDEFGFSHWSIEVGTLLSQLSAGIKMNRDYLSTVNDANSDYLATVTAQFSSQRAERSVSFAAYDDAVTDFFEPAISAGHDTPAMAYLKFKIHFFSNRSYTREILKQIVSIESSYALIDRYHSFIRVLLLLSSQTKGLNTLVPLIPSLARLSHCINDSRLTSLLQFLLPELSPSDSPQRDHLLRAFDAYTVGNYRDAITLAAAGCVDFPTCFDFYELYCKSLLHSQAEFKQLFDPTIMQGQILRCTFSILAKDQDTHGSWATLLPLAYAMNSSQLGDQLFGFAAKERAITIPFKSQTFSLLNASAQTARFSLLFETTEAKRIYLSTLLSSRYGSVAAQLFLDVATAQEGKGDPMVSSALPASRRSKYKALVFYARQDYTNAIAAFRELLNEYPNNPLIAEDALFHLFYSYLATRQLADCATMVVQAYFVNKFFILPIPLRLLVEAYVKVGAADYSSALVWPVVCYIYYSESMLPPDVKTLFVLHDSFLVSNSVTRPSELFSCISKFPRDLMTFFLRHVCVPEIMDSSIDYESTDDLEGERIRICQVLLTLDPQHGELYSEEISRLTKAAAIRDAVHQIDHSKVFIDTAGIRRSLDRSYEEFFERYRSLYKLDDRTRKAVIEYSVEGRRIKERVSVVYVDQVIELFKALFLDLRERYISSNEHGLDSYLSLRVRHGTLAGQIRSRFESKHLITTANSNTGLYNRNEYWATEFNFLGADLVALIDAQMGVFSKRIDSIIDEVKNTWIQIRSEANNYKGLFDFEFTQAELLEMYLNYGDVTELDSFVESTFVQLDARARQNLRTVRAKIKTDLRDKLMLALNELEAATKTIDERVRFSQFSDIISQCRTAIQLELEVVAGWFENIGDSPMPDYVLEHLGNTALEVVKRAHPQGSVIPTLQVSTDRKLKGHTFTALVDIMSLLIGNAVKHGGLRPAQVTICFAEIDGRIQIRIANPLGGDVDWNVIQQMLQELKRRVEEGSKNRAVRRESGTGYYKLGKLLRYDLVASTQVALKVEEPTDNRPPFFVATLTIEGMGVGM